MWPLAKVKVNAEENTQGPTDLHLLKLSCQPGSITASETPLPAPWQKLISSDADPLPLTLSPTSCFLPWTNLGWVFPARSQSRGIFLTGKWRSSWCHTPLNIMAQVTATASDITHILQSLLLKESQCLSTITFFWRQRNHPEFNSLLWIEASNALGCPNLLPAASPLRCKTSRGPISHLAAPCTSLGYPLPLRGHRTTLFRQLN